mmetsp:Transcript_9493/g.25600  ORF Transcript_9493/g.25600 Transcript_9493/m.25600 type:complete len:213 (-) Transcript_9493:461-1099(-)
MLTASLKRAVSAPLGTLPIAPRYVMSGWLSATPLLFTRSDPARSTRCNLALVTICTPEAAVSKPPSPEGCMVVCCVMVMDATTWEREEASFMSVLLVALAPADTWSSLFKSMAVLASTSRTPATYRLPSLHSRMARGLGGVLGGASRSRSSSLWISRNEAVTMTCALGCDAHNAPMRSNTWRTTRGAMPSCGQPAGGAALPMPIVCVLPEPV